MTEHAQILLRNAVDNDFEEGELVEGVTFGAVKSAQRQWLDFLHANPGSSGLPTEHQHWNWVHKARYAKSRRPYQILGVTCKGQTQALMLVSDNCLSRLGSQAGASQIYINYLSVAPWNLRGTHQMPRFVGIGRILISAAIRLSMTSGREGRIGLHSLPQADSFYEQTCGMTNLGTDITEDGLRYFEMTPDQANRFFERQQS